MECRVNPRRSARRSPPDLAQSTTLDNSSDGTSLYYYRARYYHPQLQRFISEDPIGFAGGDVNLYGYVANNPLSFTDPFGLDKKSAATPSDETCSLGLPVLPPGEDLNKNIALARRHRLRLLDPIGSAVSLTWFAIQVRPKIGPIPPGSWDYKRQSIPGRPSGSSPFVLGGNYNYGVTASALGLPPGVVLRAAGLVQILERRSAPGWSHPFPGGLAPYGDDPDDQWMISAGIDYYEQCAR
jgi:RHS repeat-associated protein